MSLDKAIAHGKEHRRSYYRAGRFDPGLRAPRHVADPERLSRY